MVTGRRSKADIVIPYAPRPPFLAFHARTERWAVVVAHRRAGKTVACVNELIRGALRSRRKAPRFAYVAPFYRQAKDVAWGYLREFAGAVPRTRFHESELRADFANGGRVRLYGADNPDGLRGIYLDGVVLDEYADMNPRVWGQVIRPALADRKGWAIFIGTPKGQNHFKELFDVAGAGDDWLRLTLPASVTGLIAADELAAARAAMSEDEYAAEFECSFEAGIIGAYYTREWAVARADGRLGRVPYDPSHPVVTAWDLGIGDGTAIWCAQLVGREVRLIDHYETSGVGLDAHVKWLRDKPYAYAMHLLPHDVRNAELGTGLTRLAVLEQLGVRSEVLERLPVDDGIAAARVMFPRCWFDEAACGRGVAALQNYRREWNDRTKAFKDRPLHDWACHSADAFRYLAMGLPRAEGAEGWSEFSQPEFVTV